MSFEQPKREEEITLPEITVKAKEIPNTLESLEQSKGILLVLGDVAREAGTMTVKLSEIIRGGKMVLEDFLPDLLKQKEIKILAVKMNIKNVKDNDKSSIVVLQTLTPIVDTGQSLKKGESSKQSLEKKEFLHVYVMDLEKYKKLEIAPIVEKALAEQANRIEKTRFNYQWLEYHLRLAKLNKK